MSEQYIGEIRAFSFGFAPRGWAQCNGQLLPINQNQALFALLGTMYGGDGRVTFALPDFRSKTPMHVGPGFTQGQSGGEEHHILTVAELPSHTHPVQGSADNATAPNPSQAVWAAEQSSPFSSRTPNTPLNASAIGAAGGNQPHENMSPYLTINYCIALVGIFPSRN